MVMSAQDSIWALGNPNAADLCLRCHFPMGWLDGRSDPVNASGMLGEDYEGVSCKICHYMYNPHFKGVYDGTREGGDWTNYWDEAGALSQPGADATYAADSAAAAAITRFDGGDFFSSNVPFSASYDFAGGGQYFVVTDDYSTGDADAKRASFADANAKHKMLYSRYHKRRDMYATCHDVSNPALHNLGASGSAPLPSETDPAYSYYHIERTFSEYMLSDYSAVGGADGTGPYDPSIFSTSHAGNKIATCQDCHFQDLPDGAQGGKGGIVRPSGSAEHPLSGIPEHWMTGGNAWVPWILASIDPTSSNYDAINEALLKQGPAVLTLDFTQGEALDPSLLLENSNRAHQMLQDAISMENTSYALSNNVFRLRLQNHTPHKVISGFPEGRRMFLNVKAYVGDDVIYEINPYDDTVGTLKGLPHAISSPALDPDEAYVDELVYEVHPSSTLTGESETFHMALATGRYKDNRIPPRGFRIAEAAGRLCEPVWHGVSDTNYFTAAEYVGGYDELEISLPPGTERVEAGLYYQTTSREFIEFLRDEINGTGGTLTGTGAGGDPAYIIQTDPWFFALKAWGDTIWQLWDHNKNVPGAAPVLMTNTFVQLDVSDVDGDGIPAYWETEYFGGSTNALPGVDSDSDGMDNYSEYVAMTDPFDAGSLFGIDDIEYVGPGVDIYFTSHYARMYELLFRTNLIEGSWVEVMSDVSGTGGSMTLSHTNALPKGFYRVGIELP
jgi:hypothetical protein